MAELVEARTELRAAKKLMATLASSAVVGAQRSGAWLMALHTRMEGVLEDNRSEYLKAVEFLRSAVTLYESLDEHVVGLLLIQQANAHFYLGEYDQAIDRNLFALCFLDTRRDPLPGNAFVPLHLAASFTGLGQWKRAELMLGDCDRSDSGDCHRPENRSGEWGMAA
jgi:hypothetical protein